MKTRLGFMFSHRNCGMPAKDSEWYFSISRLLRNAFAGAYLLEADFPTGSASFRKNRII